MDQTRKLPLEQPLIVAAYLHGDPSRKRRVKVPPNIKWMDFLLLFYSRLDLSPSLEIEIFDEKGIEIVSVEDLVENDVLVVKEKRAKSSQKTKSYPGAAGTVSMTTRMPRALGHMSHDLVEPASVIMGVPGLSHFIQSNSFGYYFLAEVENVKVFPSQGKIKKTHCVIKVPLCQRGAGTLQTFENEAILLRKISNHKCIVSAPTVQVLNFADEQLQAFYKSLPQNKRSLVQELFVSGGCLEAYMYPLYGVTMATKIRTGLAPDKVLKYSYQLADVMYYLQQRGVIHLNLLPENIQVMSNDRLILCNFETAVQTDPTTCLLVASQSVVAPSNKKGLAPEVISALSRLRIETETVDYSTQYPWSFGLLSVVMATGQHPLKDYPDAFESAFRVKYRSHHFQALPDLEQYPPIYCKLVKRSLSCDPVRRPTLPQIISIIKKDTKILAIMSRGRQGHSSGASAKSGASDVVMAAKHGREAFDPLQANKQGGTLSNKPHPSPSRRGFHETHPPSYGFSRPEDTPRDHMSRHVSHDRLPKSTSQVFGTSYESHDQSGDQYGAYNQNTDPFFPAESTGSHGNSRKWDTFNEVAKPPDSVRHLALRREGSQGNFSDDFVSPRISRESSGQTPSKQGATSSAEMLQGRVGGNSESDLSQMQEVPYQRLVHSPHAGNSSDDHPSPTPHTSDQERLVRGSSQEQEESAEGRGQEVKGSVAKKNTSELPRFRVTRSSSYRRATGHLESPLIVRRCLSDEPTRPAEEKMDTTEGATGIDSILLSAQSHDTHMTSQEYEPQSHDVHMRTQSDGSPSSGVEGILMSSCNTTTGPTTDTQTTSTSFNLTSQSQETRDSPEIMDMQSTGATQSLASGGLLSPVFSNSNGGALVTNKEFWASVMADMKSEENKEVGASRPGQYLFSLDDFPSVDMDRLPSVGNSLSGDPLSMLSPTSTSNDQPIFPQAFSETDILGNLSMPPSSQAGQAPVTARADEDLTPKDDEESSTAINVPNLTTSSVATLTSTAMDVSNWVQSVASSSDQSSTNTVQSNQAPVPYGEQNRSYNIMSPIPEASQELTSSMSQPNSHLNRLSGSHFRSVSPISEHTSSSEIPRSLSPNLPPPVSGSDHPSTQQSGASEHGSTGQGSSVLTALNVGGGQTGLASETTAMEGSQTGSTSQTNADNQAATGGNATQSSTEQVTSSFESIASSARAQVGGASDQRTKTPTPPRSSQATPTLDRDHTPSSPQANLHSSNESIGQSRRIYRGKSPQSTTSAPPTFQHSLPRPHFNAESNSQRPLSPLATTTHRSTELLDTVGRSEDPNADKENQTGNETGGMESELRNGVRRRGSTNRFRYSQLRQTELSRSQQKISQDLEMMNLAISGMDFTSTLSKSVHSEPPLTRERRSPISQRSNLPQRTRGEARSATGHAQRQQQDGSEPRFGHAQRQQNGSEQRPTAHAQRPTRGLQRMDHPSNEQRTSQRQPVRTRNDLDSSRTFRPITPALQGTIRSASAPNSSGRDSPSTPDIVPRQNPSSGVVRSNSTLGPPPPQVPADSYDYLPPYSPPRPRESSTTHERHASEPGLLAEPPPSYDEIFGGRDREGHRRRRRGERSRFSRRSHSHRETSQSTTAGDDESSQSRPSSRQSNRRLISLTNLFRRSRGRQSQSESGSLPTDSLTGQTAATAVPNSGPQDLNEYTADWVASYSRTPRPLTVSRQENLAVRSTGSVSGYSVAHSQVSRTFSDTSNSRTPPTSRSHTHNPVPYRHPPPFPSAENILQASNSVSRSYPPPQHGSSQSLNVGSSTSTRLPVRTRTGRQGEESRTSHVTRSHARPRPSSAYIPAETEHAQFGGGSTHSTPTARTRLLVGAGGMSSSCFDILTPQSTSTSTPHSSTPHTSHTAHSPRTTAPHTSTAHTTHTTTHSSHSSASLHTSQSRIRAPRIAREGKVQRGQGSTASLNQQGSTLSINANTNNVNATASPRASLTSSPVGMGSQSRMESPISFQTPTSISRASTSVSIPIGSNSQEADASLTLTPVASSPSTVVNVASQTSVASVRDCDSEAREAGVRAVMRQRAETRRMLEQGEASSDEEQHSQVSNLSQSSQRSRVKRRRRRKSMGSNSTIEVQRSNPQLNAVVENRPTRGEAVSHDQSHDQAVQSGDQRRGSRDNLDTAEHRMSRVTEERETQSIEVNIENVEDGTSTPNSLRSKSCGHPCDSGDQVLCCVCTVEQRSAAFPGSQGEGLDVINSCDLCQRRDTTANNQGVGIYGNKHPTQRTRTNEPTSQSRSGKSCSIM